MQREDDRHTVFTAIDIVEHGGSNADSENVISRRPSRDDVEGWESVTHASVKKPTPATRQTLT